MGIPILSLGDHGQNVKTLQGALNDRGKSRGYRGNPLVVDGDLGPETWGRWRELALALGALTFGGSKRAARRRWICVVTPNDRAKTEKVRAQTRKRQKAAAKAAEADSLRERAYREAVKLIGVMESGGNNRGAQVEAIIRANGGAVGEPWCGDFVAYVYRKAGSKAVDRRWASVSLLGALPLVPKVKAPRRGDIVRYSFDHTGMFVKNLGGGQIETIEGNTGASGAVSDSRTGGDGVYRKHRPSSLVTDYRKVTK